MVILSWFQIGLSELYPGTLQCFWLGAPVVVSFFPVSGVSVSKLNRRKKGTFILLKGYWGTELSNRSSDIAMVNPTLNSKPLIMFIMYRFDRYSVPTICKSIEYCKVLPLTIRFGSVSVHGLPPPHPPTSTLRPPPSNLHPPPSNLHPPPSYTPIPHPTPHSLPPYTPTPLHPHSLHPCALSPKPKSHLKLHINPKHSIEFVSLGFSICLQTPSISTPRHTLKPFNSIPKP